MDKKPFSFNKLVIIGTFLIFISYLISFLLFFDLFRLKIPAPLTTNGFKFQTINYSMFFLRNSAGHFYFYNILNLIIIYSIIILTFIYGIRMINTNLNTFVFSFNYKISLRFSYFILAVFFILNSLICIYSYLEKDFIFLYQNIIIYILIGESLGLIWYYIFNAKTKKDLIFSLFIFILSLILLIIFLVGVTNSYI